MLPRWSDRYHDPARLQAELDELWPRAWHAVAPSHAVPEGTTPVTLGRDGVLLVRGDRLRAFLNVCPHRALPVCEVPGGALRCAYHGWTFADDGSPRGLAMRGLTPVAVEERAGLVWVSLRPDEPLDVWLADLPLPPTLHVVGAIAATLACNWKHSVEVHGEGEHVPLVHPQVAHAVDWSRARASRHGRHGRLRVDTSRIGTVDLLFVFPDLHLNLHAQGGLVFRHVPDPVDPERCRFEQWTLGHPEAELWWPSSVPSTDPRFGAVTGADLRIAEALQVGTRSAGPEAPPWLGGETLLADFHEELDRW